MLAIYASTGRTGSTFLCRLFQWSPPAAVFHGRVGERWWGNWCHPERSIARGTADEMAAGYLACIEALDPGKDVYVEGNPRFVEAVAQTHAISDPREVVKLVQAQGVTVRCLFMVRNPADFALSMKNRFRELGRTPWLQPEVVGETLSVETFETVYGFPADEFMALDTFGKTCASWVLRNRFLKPLVDLEECLFIKFEDLFDPDASDMEFVRMIQEIHEHVRLPACEPVDKLIQQRQRRRNASVKLESLTDEEMDRLKTLCGAAASEWGYRI